MEGSMENSMIGVAVEKIGSHIRFSHSNCSELSNSKIEH